MANQQHFETSSLGPVGNYIKVGEIVVQNFSAVVSISLIEALLKAVLLSTLWLALKNFDSASEYYYYNGTTTASTFASTMLEGTVWTALVLTCTNVVSAGFQGALVRLVAEAFAGRSPTARECFRHSFDGESFPSLLSFGQFQAFMAVAVVGLGRLVQVLSADNETLKLVAALCIVACMLLGAAVSLEPSIILVEGTTNPFSAMYRSWQLCKNNLCLVFAVSIVFPTILEALSLCATAIMTSGNVSSLSLASIPDPLDMALYVHLTWSTCNIGGNFHSLLKTVLYLSLRIQKEGLTKSQLQNELNRPVSSEKECDDDDDQAYIPLSDDDNHGHAVVVLV